MSCFLIPTGVMYCTIILSKDKKKCGPFHPLLVPQHRRITVRLALAQSLKNMCSHMDIWTLKTDTFPFIFTLLDLKAA